MKKIILILVTFLLFGCSANQKIINIPNTYTEYNLDKFNDLYLLPITLNGKRTKLIVDTGASKSLLDINKCEYFGYTYTVISLTKYVGIGGATDIYVVYDYNVDLFYVSFLGADLIDITSYFRIDGNQIVGILGSDFLFRAGAIIDYTTNKLYLNTGYKVYINPIGNNKQNE